MKWIPPRPHYGRRLEQCPTCRLQVPMGLAEKATIILRSGARKGKQVERFFHIGHAAKYPIAATVTFRIW